MLLVSLLVSGVAAVTGHKLDGAQFGSSSSYFTVANQDVTSLEVFDGCQPLMMWMYVRHGSRNPGPEDIEDMVTLLPALRDRILAASNAGEGFLSQDEIKDLKEWTFAMDVEDEHLLTSSGKKEGKEMGSRWKKRFPNFLANEKNVESWSSEESRSVETGKSFLEGLEMDPEGVVVDNRKGVYYKGEFGCERYIQEVYDNDEVTHVEAIKLTQSQAWAKMIEDVSNRTGVEMTPELASLALDMCKYQLAWEPERYTDTTSGIADFPPWCNLFSKYDTTLFEFEEDLELHYEAGPAFEITTMAPHKVFKDLYSLLDAHSSGENETVVLTFGHRGGLLPLINAFEIYRDDFNLTASDWGTDVVQNHLWKISDIGTFASNIGVILYQCPESVPKVMLVHNEHIVDKQPACGETLCTVEEFKAHYQHIVDFDWDKECPMENGGNTNISLLSSIIIIVTSFITFYL